MQIFSKNNYIKLLNFEIFFVKQKIFEEGLLPISYSSCHLQALQLLNLTKFYSILKSIDWSLYDGNTYFEKFFKIVNQIFFIDYILIDFFTKIRFVTIKNRPFLCNFLYKIIVKYCNDYFIKLDIIFIANLSASFIEVFILKNIFFYDLTIKHYLLNIDFYLFPIEHLCTIVKYNWPLIIPANDYILIKDKYVGGYYTKNNLLTVIQEDLFYNDFISLIDTPFKNDSFTLTDINLKYISMFQHQTYILIHNPNIIKFILIYFKHLTTLLNKGTDYSLNILHKYYTLYQYLVFIESNILEIYYPFQIDSLGNLVHVVEFGLTLKFTDRLSRYLIGFGKQFLIDTEKQEHELFILNSINTDLVKANKLKIYSLYDLNMEFILSKDNFDTEYSIENLVLLSDWYYNILPYNYTEITFKFNLNSFNLDF